MQKVIINNLVIPTAEVIAKVFPKSDYWGILGAKTQFWTLLILVSVNLIAAISWFWEHIIRNCFFRYKLESAHSSLWFKNNIQRVKARFMEKGLFEMKKDKPFQEWHGGSIYCFCLINKGTTHDYIYKAELTNGKKRVDISTERIVKGVLVLKENAKEHRDLQYKYIFENLPHGFYPLQGEVWFVAASDDDFINLKTPTLIIKTAVKEYSLKLTEEMFVESLGIEPNNADIQEGEK